MQVCMLVRVCVCARTERVLGQTDVLTEPEVTPKMWRLTLSSESTLCSLHSHNPPLTSRHPTPCVLRRVICLNLFFSGVYRCVIQFLSISVSHLVSGASGKNLLKALSEVRWEAKTGTCIDQRSVYDLPRGKTEYLSKSGELCNLHTYFVTLLPPQTSSSL